MPQKTQALYTNMLNDLKATLIAYFQGQTAVCALLALYYAIALKSIGLSYGISIGLASGFLAFIPYVGFSAGLLIALGVAAVQFTSWPHILTVLGVYLFAQFVESFYLTPKLVGDKIGVHPLWIIFALMAGGLLFGFMGVLLSLPVAALIRVIMLYGLRSYHTSTFFLDRRARSNPVKSKNN
jgi:predicted PurR-regulated permease PerM